MFLDVQEVAIAGGQDWMEINNPWSASANVFRAVVALLSGFPYRLLVYLRRQPCATNFITAQLGSKPFLLQQLQSLFREQLSVSDAVGLNR